MTITDNKLVSALRVILQTEFGIKLTQEEASILANTLGDFFEALALIEHKKDCLKKDELEKFLRQKWGGWSEPIIKDGLLVEISPVDWQLLTALVANIDEQGECKPSLEDLCAVLGLADIASVSKRIRKLEKKTFESLPLITVNRSKKQNDKGVWVFTNNQYQLHPTILAIFRIPLARKSHLVREDE